MSFTRITDEMENISGLSDRPNDSDGLSAAQLKALFDAPGVALKKYVNEVLLPELESKEERAVTHTTPSGSVTEFIHSGAYHIGVGPIAGLSEQGYSLQLVLSMLYEAISEATVGSIPDGSLTAAKYGSLSIPTRALGQACVTEGKIGPGAVTEGKYASRSIPSTAYKTGSVDGNAMAAASVGTNKLGAKAVTGPKIGDNTIDTRSYKDGSVTPEKTSGLQKSIQKVTVTLSASGWVNNSQSVTIAGFTAESEFVASPADASGWSAAGDADLYPPEAVGGGLRFSCESVPTADIQICVYWW